MSIPTEPPPTDLLARLRAPDIALWDEQDVTVPLCREAADEIERLHTVIRAAREELAHGGGGVVEAYLILKHSGVS